MHRFALLVALALLVAACGEVEVDAPWLDATGDTTGGGDDATPSTDTTPSPDAPDATTGADTTTTAADTTTSADTSTSSPDTTQPADTAQPGDTTQPDPCAGVTCSGHGTCVADRCQCDSGYVPQGLTECVMVDPCASVDCGANARCELGSCICVPGFVSVNGSCLAEDPGNPATRTPQMVCERFQRDFATTSQQVFDPGQGQAACDPGTIDPVAHDDAMRRLNLYRWLVGVEPAGVDWGNQATSQAAAFMMHVNNRLSHSPDSSWTCYSAAGAAGAGSSNLGLGYYHPADTVVGYIRDNGTPSLGHRRWCFNPSLDAVGFGHYGSGGAMHAFGTGAHSEPDFVAYPSPGPFPIQALHGDWSFSRRQGFSNSFTVTVTRLSDGTNIPVTATDRGSTFGFLATLGFSVPGATAGETYRVEVVDGARTYTYETTLVSCP